MVNRRTVFQTILHSVQRGVTCDVVSIRDLKLLDVRRGRQIVSARLSTEWPTSRPLSNEENFLDFDNAQILDRRIHAP